MQHVETSNSELKVGVCPIWHHRNFQRMIPNRSEIWPMTFPILHCFFMPKELLAVLMTLDWRPAIRATTWVEPGILFEKR
jgi:hypothetical protein